MFAFLHGRESQWPADELARRTRGLGMTPEEHDKKWEKVTYQAGLDSMEKMIAKTKEEGNIALIKEHSAHLFDAQFLSSGLGVPSFEAPRPALVDHRFDVVDSKEAEVKLPIPNPTLLPDRILASSLPVIMIRHPVFTYPSYERAASVYTTTVFDLEFTVMTSYKWSRIMYDFYRSYYEKTDPEGKMKDWPIVVDGDRLVEDTKGQMKKFCDIARLDESDIQYSWEVAGLGTDEKALISFLRTIKESTGVIKGPVKKWTEEWDEKVAQRMKEAVESAMDDYNYLLARCI
ncbi:hypothetical protein BDP27DRAFT_1364740 [Rhodocollybia butyracea]|uniref:Sulfotransferase n=1 Tax=Rhodocollybia butyracea TaxID=206335 RepID=A0A9P5PPM7_9AGAR|nr:hypothetical protein BDP27DRAFT_1364740 [Rhodocollybia butyracea]